MKGAVQGEATATASTPVRKASSTGWRACRLATLEGRNEPNSNRPARFSPIRVNSAASAATTPGTAAGSPSPGFRRRRAGQQQRAQRGEGQHHAGGVGQAAEAVGAPVIGVAGEATTLMASTGNTQGIRFRIRPPSSAPSSASTSEVEPPAGAAAVAAALALRAVSGALDTPGPAATLGHSPTTLSSARQPWPPDANTTGIKEGLFSRCGASGMLAVHSAPFQACLGVAAVSITSGVSGKTSSVLPRNSTGRPCTLKRSRLPSIRTTLSGRMPWVVSAGRGWALKAASNAAPLSAVEPLRGIWRANSPSSGMHSLRHTSQDALSLMSSVLPVRGGLKSGVIVSGTGSSTVPS
jgi:hypothetical protein